MGSKPAAQTKQYGVASSTDKRLASSLLNVPNQLTVARLVLALIVFVLIPLHHYLAATITFLIAAATDWIDGWWARRYGQITKLGRILDPFVDKIIICGAFILLATEMSVRAGHFPWYAVITGWMAVLVVGREMLVTALRSFIEQSGGDFSARMSGKLKMVFQCAATVGALVLLRYEQPPPVWLCVIVAACIWLAVMTTVYSGAAYLVAAVRFLRR